MHSFHDQVWVPASLVWRALTSPMGKRGFIHLVTRRVVWAPLTPIDHAVTFIRLFVGKAAEVVENADEASNISAQSGTSPQPKRYRLPDHLRKRDILKQNFAEKSENLFYSLLADDDFTSAQVDDQNRRITEALRQAVSEAQHMPIGDDDVDVVSTGAAAIRRERGIISKASEDLFRLRENFRKRRRTESTDAKQSFKRERKRLNTVLCTAKQALLHLYRTHKGRCQNESRRREPRAYWKRQHISSTDPGAPVMSTSFLLDHQTDENGSFVTANKKRLRSNLRENRRQLYEVPALHDKCNRRYEESLAELHLENCEVPGVSESSAAARSARDACAPSAAADARRGIRRNLRDAIDVARTRRNNDNYPLHVICRKFADAVATRDRRVTVEEIQQVCSWLKDSGPGTDGLPPALLQRIGEGHTASAFCVLFNNAFETGMSPEPWSVHRTLFLYKGKNTDPFCLENYRGISIDQLCLKIWALLLNARLEVFLEQTGGLSSMQGGFRRLRGPPESVLALSETVRAAIKRQQTVEALFLDVKVAYDSVLHPILWKNCIDKGVGGKFLASLQAIYHDASSRVDVKGQLLEKVPLLRGVLQGNPLSSLLFNIYLDGAINDLNNMRTMDDSRPVGLWLPRTDSTQAQDATKDDYLPCLFFADDGVLAEVSHDELQRMVDQIADSLAQLGLEIHVRKTKWMLIPSIYVEETQYRELAKKAAENPIRIYGQAVALVDEFDYLGMRLWWRWDFSKAWEAAAKRARKAYFGALRGGWQRRAGSLFAQLEYARAKIFSHFHYVAAVAGVGGRGPDAPWRACEKIVGWVLRTISGLPRANLTALKVEAGYWDDGSHVLMMVLRFWRKCSLVLHTDSTVARAIRLSFATTCLTAQQHPVGYNDNPSRLRFQTWAQHVYAAADSFGITRNQVNTSSPDLIHVQVRHVWDNNWNTANASTVVGASDEIRLIVAGRNDIVYEPDVNCWELPNGTSVESALSRWTPALKAATYAALRKRGNSFRNQAVQTFLTDLKQGNTHLQVWASSISGSRLQPYWMLDNSSFARWVLKARFDECPTEDRVRSQDGRVFKRIEDRRSRVCYACNGTEETVPIAFCPETFVHVMFSCTNQRLVRARRTFREALTAIVSQDNGDVPDVQDDSTLLAILLLCTGLGPVVRSHQPCHGPCLQCSSAAASRAVHWMQGLFDEWAEVARDPRRTQPLHQTRGHQLASLVANHIKGMFDERQAILSAAPLRKEFQSRSRDPPSLRSSKKSSKKRSQTSGRTAPAQGANLQVPSGVEMDQSGQRSTASLSAGLRHAACSHGIGGTQPPTHG